jgi:hypothetical protein
MTHLTSDIDKKIIKRASETAQKRMPKDDWNRKDIHALNLFNTYLMESLQAEYNQLLLSANAHGYIQGISKSLTVSQSLKAFYDDI